jgi:hypothetical protein
MTDDAARKGAKFRHDFCERVAEYELRQAVEVAIRERRVDGDLQCWVDALQRLYAGEDVSVYETAKGGRGRVI